MGWVCTVVLMCGLHFSTIYRHVFNYYVKIDSITINITPINFRKQIQIPSGVKFLYASLFDSSNAYFAAPQNVTLIIDSQDGKTNYKHKTDIESLYIQMTKDGQSLQKLCVRNPEAGTWTIIIKAMTNTPVYFQFQTVSTKDTYATMQATLSPHSVLGKIGKILPMLTSQILPIPKHLVAKRILMLYKFLPQLVQPERRLVQLSHGPQ